MKPETSERGSLFLEVLASMALLSLIFLALAPAMILSAKKNAAASDETFASTMAYDMAENLKREPCDAMSPGYDLVFQRQVAFDRSWTIANDTPQIGMKTVTVTVTPRRKNPHGKNREAIVRFYRVP